MNADITTPISVSRNFRVSVGAIGGPSIALADPADPICDPSGHFVSKCRDLTKSGTLGGQGGDTDARPHFRRSVRTKWGEHVGGCDGLIRTAETRDLRGAHC